MEKILNTKIKNGDTTIEIPDSIKAFLRKQNLDNDDLTIFVNLLLREMAGIYDIAYDKGYDKGVEDEFAGNVKYKLNYDNPEVQDILNNL